MDTKQFDCPLSLKVVAEDGFFAGYASVFNVVDSQYDSILPGAFSNTLRQRKYNQAIPLLWQHHADEPIGTLTTLREDGNGLYVEGRILLSVQCGREAHALLKSGVIEGLSIGYTAVDYQFDEQTGVRYLSEVELWEISLVTFPANPEAGVISVKEMDFFEVLQALERAMKVVSGLLIK